MTVDEPRNVSQLRTCAWKSTQEISLRCQLPIVLLPGPAPFPSLSANATEILSHPPDRLQGGTHPESLHTYRYSAAIQPTGNRKPKKPFSYGYGFFHSYSLYAYRFYHQTEMILSNTTPYFDTSLVSKRLLCFRQKSAGGDSKRIACNNVLTLAKNSDAFTLTSERCAAKQTM